MPAPKVLPSQLRQPPNQTRHGADECAMSRVGPAAFFNILPGLPVIQGIWSRSFTRVCRLVATLFAVFDLEQELFDSGVSR